MTERSHEGKRNSSMSRKTFIICATGGIARKRHRTGRFILANFALKRGVELEELVGQDRRQPLASIRQEAYKHVQERTSLSLNDIGGLFDGRHHTTILHGINASIARASA